MTKATPPRDDAQRIADAIRTIARQLRIQARAAEAEVGLGAAQLLVLARLAEGRGMSVGEIATGTRTDPSSASAVVGRLVERGLATRRRSEEDERRVEIAITAAGRALLRRSPTAARPDLTAAVEALPAAKRGALARLLEELVGAMSAPAKESAAARPVTSKRRGKRAAR